MRGRAWAVALLRPNQAQSSRPWCENGAYALGLGILTPHTMVGAKAAPRHGCGEKQK
jgi:hypothetical protein